MNNIPPHLQYVSNMAGEYIDSLGKTDLANFSKQEWFTLMDIITRNYHEKYIDNNNENNHIEDIPYF